MNKQAQIESFLKLISEIFKNGIPIDSNLVYSNLISMYSERESTSEYFDLWQKDFQNSNHMQVFVNPNWNSFCQFKSYGEHDFHNQIKMYVPLDKNHIYHGVCQLFDFIDKNHITHISKVSDMVRFDDVVLRVDDVRSALKIADFVEKNSYIQEGLISKNPFSPSYHGISVTWDGSLSYNFAVSEWIADYINELKKCNQINSVSYEGFYHYVKNKYEQIFIKGIALQDFYCSRKHVKNIEGFLDYKFVTEILLSSLGTSFEFSDLCSKVEYMNDPAHYATELQNLQKLFTRFCWERVMTPQQQESLRYVCMEIAKKDGMEYLFAVLKEFAKSGNYRLFTRKNNVRKLMLSSGITPDMIGKFVYEEQKIALTNASLETIRKYDSVQLGRALSSLIQNKQYQSFTNEHNVRQRLQMMVKPEEVQSLMESIVQEEIASVYNLEDAFWIFVELMKEKEQTKSK